MDVRKELISIFKKFNAAERLEGQAYARGDDKLSVIKSKEMRNLNKKFWFLLRKRGLDVPKPKDRDIGLYGNLTTSPPDFVDNWLNEAVVQRGVNDVYGDAPSDMGTDNEDSILANDEYGQDKDEKNLVKEVDFDEANFRDKFRGRSTRRSGPDGEEYNFPQDGQGGWRYGDLDRAQIFITNGTDVLEWDGIANWGIDSQDELAGLWHEWMEMLDASSFGEDGPILNPHKRSIEEAEPVRSKKDIQLLRKLGYSEERIARIDRSESEVILMNHIPANRSDRGTSKKYKPDRRRNTEGKRMEKKSIKEKENAFWTEVNENLFTKASMTLGKTFLPGEDEEDIDEAPDDQYNRYEDVVFLQGEEANEAIEIIQRDGPDAGIKFLSQWHCPGEHMMRDELPHGTGDNVYHGDGYLLFWNSTLPYVGLTYDTAAGE